ncbi:hypothetical protein J3T65_06645 [Staphylococcus simiae]|uniref:hypothetical protein n=1 Tax=Staphylococcus simiae TaxID=308354 RepID=UPI001A95E180|nr:hypothetical protein [Staphylococcus simiae]MBO1199219.1 hypothetical protein [Staphylococcus simiae]MBO1201378.1 hypothetical protein [Staphylococcus simiae]MBO1203568.1 hypothetical protein [Staphylococcus simiae]MBO1211191.1 hypothetical protein [Staphylococcus simiae]MBO1229758.1 hypothetical protein [Staphylococcus simiae]
MSRSKKFFYLSCLMIIISFFFNTNNDLLSTIFASIVKLIFVCSIVNTAILILAILFADRSIKALKPDSDWIRVASKSLPWIIFVVIVIHALSMIHTFGII